MCVCVTNKNKIVKAIGKFLYSALSSPQDCSSGLPVSSLADVYNQISTYLGSCILQLMQVQIPTTVYSHVLIYTAA